MICFFRHTAFWRMRAPETSLLGSHGRVIQPMHGSSPLSVRGVRSEAWESAGCRKVFTGPSKPAVSIQATRTGQIDKSLHNCVRSSTDLGKRGNSPSRVGARSALAISSGHHQGTLCNTQQSTRCKSGSVGDHARWKIVRRKRANMKCEVGSRAVRLVRQMQ